MLPAGQEFGISRPGALVHSELDVELVPVVADAVVESSGPGPCPSVGNFLPLWTQVWQSHAPMRRASDVGVGTGTATRPCPMLDVVEVPRRNVLVISPQR